MLPCHDLEQILLCFAEDVPIASANYIEAGSELKAKIEIAYPIKTMEDIQSKAIIADPKEVNLWFISARWIPIYCNRIESNRIG